MDLTRLVEQGEAEANEDMFRAAPRALAEALGLEAFRIADATALVMRQVDDAQFNRVFGLGLERPVRPESLDEVVARYRPLGLSRARLQLIPGVEQQAGVADWLVARGMARQPGGWTKRARATVSLPEVDTELSIIDAADAPGSACRT